MIEISMRDANDFVESVVLEQENLKLHFAWNDEAYCWYVDVRTMTNEDIVQAIAVVPNFPLLTQYRRVGGLPPGELMAVVVDENDPHNQTIGRDDFINGRFTMVYIPEAEVNADKSVMEKAVQSAFS